MNGDPGCQAPSLTMFISNFQYFIYSICINKWHFSCFIHYMDEDSNFPTSHTFCLLFLDHILGMLSWQSRFWGGKMNDCTNPSAAPRQRPLVLCCSVVRWHHKLLAWIKSALRHKILSAVHFKIRMASRSIHQTLSACLSVYLQLTGISAQPM